MTPGVAVTALGVTALLVAEWRGADRARVWLKALASAGFLLAAVRLGSAGASLPTGAGWLLLAGLALSAAGDVALGLPGQRRFLAGMAAFSCAHLAYGAWFTRGAGWQVLLGAAVALMVAGHLAWRWLEPNVPERIRLPVRGYVALVSLMAASAIAFGVSATGGIAPLEPATLAPALGGVLFYLSDLAVARNRFVAPGFVNRAWGLPVYYAAQLLIASAVL